MPNSLLYIYVGILGLLLGSFVNVVALRQKNKKSIITGRSQCPHCHHTLAWYDLVPLLSYIFLQGKCHYCHKGISIRYPLVELVAAKLTIIAFYLGYFQYHSPIAAIFLGLSFLLFLIMTLTDLASMYVDTLYVVFAGVIGFLALYLGGQLEIASALLGMLVGAGLIILISYGWQILRHEKGMGDGDIWIAGAIGLTLGYPLVLVSLFTAIIIGGIIGVILLLVGSEKLKSRIPFGPFLFAGLVITLIYGTAIITWYGY